MPISDTATAKKYASIAEVAAAQAALYTEEARNAPEYANEAKASAEAAASSASTASAYVSAAENASSSAATYATESSQYATSADQSAVEAAQSAADATDAVELGIDGVYENLASTDDDKGSSLLGFKAVGEGATQLTVESELRTRITTSQYGINQSINDNTSNFESLESEHVDQNVDLRGEVYQTTKDFDGNKYHNGCLRYVAKLLPDYPDTRLQTRGKGDINSVPSGTPFQPKSGLRLGIINQEIQGAVLDYYTNTLFCLVHVAGSIDDYTETNKIVAYNWYGQNILTPIWETNASLDIGHQSLGLTIGRNGYISTQGTRQIWCLAGSSKTTERALYAVRFTPAANTDIMPEFFKLFDNSFNNKINTICTDPQSKLLIATGKKVYGQDGDGNDLVRYYARVFDTSIFINGPGDYSTQYLIEFEIADFIRDMQDIACDGSFVYVIQAGSAISSTQKYLHTYNLLGVYCGVQQVLAGANRAQEIADNGGTLLFEPEALFFRPIDGGWDLVYGNTNGVPSGQTYRETSFYTLRPQQNINIKSTDSVIPGLVIDSGPDIATPTGVLSIGQVSDGTGSFTEHLNVTINGLLISGTDSNAKQFRCKNSLREANYHVSAAGIAGVYDHTNSKWVIQSNLAGTQNNIGAPLSVSGAVTPTTNNAFTSGSASLFWSGEYSSRRYWSALVFDSSGTGSPEGVLTASPGSQYRRLDGTVGTYVYEKQSGTGNTGWVAKA